MSNKSKLNSCKETLSFTLDMLVALTLDKPIRSRKDVIFAQTMDTILRALCESGGLDILDIYRKESSASEF